MTRVLVLYYSFEGNTRCIAEAIARSINADLAALKPKKEPNSHGGSKYLWGGKQVVMKETPPLEPLDVDVDAYDLIFVGTPVWAFTFTPAIRTVLKEKLIQGSSLAIFCVHEGGMKSTLTKMANAFEKLSNNIVAQNNFVNVLVNKEDNEKKAAEWAKSVLENLSSG